MKKNITQRKVERALQRVRDKYNIHDRAFNGRDFYRICKGENIGLMNKRFFPEQHWQLYRRLDGLLGFHMRINGWSYILLRSFFVGRFDVVTAFHELGHYFLGHSPSAAKARFNPFDGAEFDYDSYIKSANEIEADLFAELATGREVEVGYAQDS
jgi:hypothetical protein